MGHLNIPLTCIVTFMTGYLGTYPAYVETGGPPWSLHYEASGPPEAPKRVRVAALDRAA
jgi:hypothetical protein